MRRRQRLAPLAVALLLQIGAAGCARAEQSVVSEFFAASRLRDRTRLGAIATTVFEPATDGIVTGFRIAAITPERRTPWSGSTADTRLLELSPVSRTRGIGLARDVAGAGDPGEGLAIVSRDVTVVARVRPLEGAAAERVLVITLERVVLARGGESPPGRWIVTGVREGRAAAARPREGTIGGGGDL